MTEIGWAKLVYTALFAALILAAYTFSRENIYRGAPDAAAWRDLRLWAVALVLLHAVVYWAC